MAYAKDMQEDKEQVFDAADALALSVAAATGMARDLRFDATRLLDATRIGFVTATDLADWLVQTLGMPFRDAHHVTGELVRLAEEQHCDLADLALADMRAVEPGITEAVYSALRIEDAVASRTSFGGTAPERVLGAVRAARERFL
jgi:argininosuccinate lyase